MAAFAPSEDSRPRAASGSLRYAAGRAAARGALWLYLAAVSIFLAVPVFIVVLISFDTADYVQFPPRGLTLKWFEYVFASESLMLALRNSAIVGVGCTLMALAVGVPAALVVARRRFLGRDTLYALLLSPLTVPWIVVGLAILFLWVSLGLEKTLFGLMVGHAVVGLPYVVRTCVAVLSGIAPSYELAARTLGAGRIRTFFLITLPMMRMGIVAGAVFSFLISFINVPVPLFMTTSDNLTLPVAIFSYMLSNFDPGVAAISTVQLVLILLAFYIAQRFANLGNFLE